MLVSYAAQPGGGGAGVPDAEMRASFRFLFEVKTVPDQIAGQHAQKQLGRHLDRLDGSHRTELLVVLTPDAGPPPLVESMGDPRVVWTSFEALAEAIRGLLDDAQEPASEQQRFLLRELLALFEQDRLVGIEDVAVVAAAHAYDVWLRSGAYICQANRTFRRVRHWGFYRSKRIEPEFPRVDKQWPSVIFDEDVAAEHDSGDDADRRLAQLIRAVLSDGEGAAGDERGVYLLQPADDPDLPRRDKPLPHPEPGAWTRGQRYASLERLVAADTTADL